MGELRRMRLIASGLLVLMAAVFVAAGLAAREAGLAPGARYIRAFAEAGVVGACADWFAVTALFRRPLGLPIPHTAIVPRNKDRIGLALGRFIAENFLTVRVLDERVRRLEPARRVGAWLARPEVARGLASRLAGLAPDLFDALPPGALQALAGEALVALVEATPIAKLAALALGAIWSDGQAQSLVDRAAERLGAYLSDHQDVVLERVQAQSYRWLPTWIDRIIAQKIVAGLIQLLADVRDPDHPWRAQISQAIARFIDRLGHDSELQAQGEALKRRLLDDPQLRDHLQSAGSDLERRLGADLRARPQAVAAGLERGLTSLGAWLQNDLRVRRALDLWSRALVRRVVAPRRDEIGRFVSQVVAGWDTQFVVEKLELQAGPDLQYIRVNGALVGGLVGLILYSLSQAMGL